MINRYICNSNVTPIFTEIKNMATGQKIGEVTKPSANRGTAYAVFWDRSSGKVYVANESAGTASSESDAMHVADFYASTGKTKHM